jgi:hypothetical protein
MASEEKNSSKLKFLNWILVVAIFLFIGLLVIYYFNIFPLDEIEKGKWGTFGDFIGGTLNPLFALFSLFAIIYTIKIQTKELELSREELEATRKELEGSRIAQQEQSESLKLQNKATKLQIFENTFFQLINLFIETRKEFHINLIRRGGGAFKLLSNNDRIRLDSSEDNLKYDGKESIVIYLEIIKQKYQSNYDSFNKNYEENTGTYFGQIYQILKFIDESNIENKQRYVNIFRAQFTKDELEFLFYHCLGTIGKRKFKKLVEDYEFFEHIILNENIQTQLLEYDKKAFGKNEKILKLFE